MEDSVVWNEEQGVIFTLHRKWTAQDACGNVQTCSYTITSVDTTMPYLIPPAPLEVSCSDSDLTTLIDNWITEVDYGDDCSEADLQWY